MPLPYPPKERKRADHDPNREEYRAGLGDGREIWIYGKRVSDVTARPAFKPGVDLKARMYDMAHEPAWAAVISYQEGGHYTHCLWAYRGRQQRPKRRRHSTPRRRGW